MTIATGLNVAQNVGHINVLKIVRATGGMALAVDDDTIRAVIRDEWRHAGSPGPPKAPRPSPPCPSSPTVASSAKATESSWSTRPRPRNTSRRSGNASTVGFDFLRAYLCRHTFSGSVVFSELEVSVSPLSSLKREDYLAEILFQGGTGQTSG